MEPHQLAVALFSSQCQAWKNIIAFKDCLKRNGFLYFVWYKSCGAFCGPFLASRSGFIDLSSHLDASVTPRSAGIQREILYVGCYLDFTISLLEWKQLIWQVRLPQQWKPQTECCNLCQDSVETFAEKCEETMNDTFTLQPIRLEGSVHSHRLLRLKLHNRSNKSLCTFKADSLFYKSDKLML